MAPDRGVLAAAPCTASGFAEAAGEMMSVRAHLHEESLIRHMRRKRRRMLERRRRRRLLTGAAAIGLAVASALAVASFTGADLGGAATARAQSLIDLLDKRSPGRRTQGELTKTKVRHVLLATRLAAVPAPRLPAALEQVLAAPPAALLPVDVGTPQLEMAAAPLLPPGIFASPPGGGGGVIGPPGGGGPGSPPGQPPLTPVPPPAVPEPGTWLTMLVGFGLMGCLLRRRSVRRTPAPATGTAGPWDEVRSELMVHMSRCDVTVEEEAPQPVCAQGELEPYFGPSREAGAAVSRLFGLPSDSRQPDWERALDERGNLQKAIDAISDGSLDTEARTALALLLLDAVDTMAGYGKVETEIVSQIRWQIRRDPKVQARMRYWWTHMHGSGPVMEALR